MMMMMMMMVAAAATATATAAAAAATTTTTATTATTTTTTTTMMKPGNLGSGTEPGNQLVSSYNKTGCITDSRYVLDHRRRCCETITSKDIYVSKYGHTSLSTIRDLFNYVPLSINQ